MCGIIGYIGKEEACRILLEGISRLEYRGYDSMGISVLNSKGIVTGKDAGKVDEVRKKIDFDAMHGSLGIAHTRWATNGVPSRENAHPHSDCGNEISIVHNGIIENFSELKAEMISKGHKFRSQTDTEVISHLIEEHYKGNLFEAVRHALNKVTGSYALGIISSKEPDKIIAARNESPLIIGVGNEGMFIASDVPAIMEHTRDVIYIDDKEIAVISKDNASIFGLDGNIKNKKIVRVEWDKETAEKSGYEHFMLKEIHEQPKAVTDTLMGMLKKGEVVFDENFRISNAELKSIRKIVMIACGTSWHASLVGEFMFEELAKIQAEVEYASEFRYRNPIIDKDTLVIAVSQSGETADTIAALKKANELGAKTLSVCNVAGSSLTRAAGSTIYTKAGPEIGVASTKAFTTQLAVLYLLTIKLSRLRGTLNDAQIESMIAGIRKIPLQIQSVLDEDNEIIRCAELYCSKANSLYLGRGVNFPIALEGALKLKEVSYIHAEG
ncbi:glutamine--fructose-6-phosphate transaminase (isomerizing), partial [Candidatus Woesearchaeota archaeon]|nr:glutamine--fructose-6-phosphate transaminase (isomerizing) [Candidatus Woesearchaeota archaeon]